MQHPTFSITHWADGGVKIETKERKFFLDSDEWNNVQLWVTFNQLDHAAQWWHLRLGTTLSVAKALMHSLHHNRRLGRVQTEYRALRGEFGEAAQRAMEHFRHHRTAGCDWPDDAAFALQTCFSTWPKGWNENSELEFFPTREALEDRVTQLQEWAQLEDNYVSYRGFEWDLGPQPLAEVSSGTRFSPTPAEEYWTKIEREHRLHLERLRYYGERAMDYNVKAEKIRWAQLYW